MVNRMRSTRAHTRNRRSHHALDGVRLATDKTNGIPHLRHRASLTTGTYRGRTVIDVAGKLIKKQEKQKAKTRAAGKEEKKGDSKK